MVRWFHLGEISLFLTGGLLLGLVIVQWWRDISREGTLLGQHTAIVELGLRWGIVLFIVSEVFFFLSFFWAFFHRRLSPRVELGSIWPPLGIKPFNPLYIPLLNTLLLVTSGLTITISHHAIMQSDGFEALVYLGATIVLGTLFTFLQGFEYVEASFRISDRVYGSTFFIATGFHGIHVLVGTIFFLAVTIFRHASFRFRSLHHFGFEAAAWYWHFVDVVWLFLYLVVYVWGGL